MFGSITSSQATQRKKAHLSLQSQADSSMAAAAGEHTQMQHDGSETDSLRPSLNKATAVALSTPHDAVLAELHGQRSPVVPSGAIADSDTPGASKLHALQTADISSAALLRSAASSPVSENVFDPFTGVAVGIMSQINGKDGHADPGFEQTKDELWSHLARIRDLQIEIAGMHSQMEGMGTNDTSKHKRAAPSSAGVHSDTIGAAEWEEHASQEHKKSSRDAEFTNLAEIFEGRRAAIDGIMNKVRYVDPGSMCSSGSLCSSSSF